MSLRVVRRVVAVLCAALCLLGLTTVASNAAHKPPKHKAVPRVTGVAKVSEDWYHSSLAVRWKKVAGATYQYRWSSNRAMTHASRPKATRAVRATVAPLARNVTWYFEARAVKAHKVGKWSSPRGIRFTNKWPATPTPSEVGVAGGVKVSWGYSSYASRYRVLWSPGPYGQWPGATRYVDRTSGGWVPQTARTSTLKVPTSPTADSTMTSVQYGNPVFTRVEANNAYLSGASHFSAWKLAWPKGPTPVAGDPVRMGSYNVRQDSAVANATALANNIASHHLTVAALQEAPLATAQLLIRQLGANWAMSTSAGDESQVIYDSTKFSEAKSGVFSLTNNSTGKPLKMAWARLQPVAGSPWTRPFYVVSVHLTFKYPNATDDAKLRQDNAETGQNATNVLTDLARINTTADPVIVAGDFTSNRYPAGDTHSAQPTFIRAGYYDAMAANAKSGVAYSTVNGLKHESPGVSGVGTRADYIVFKGFRGLSTYVDVPNYTYGGKIPSDHNLIYADLQVPN